MYVPHLLEVWTDNLLRDTGPPVEIARGEPLCRVLAGGLHVQLDDLRLRREMHQPEAPAVGNGVDGEGTGDDPGDSHGVQPVYHPAGLEDGEVAAPPSERRRYAGHGLDLRLA